VKVISIATPTHGRVLVEDPAGAFSGFVLVGCHGYRQGADTMLEEMRRIPGSGAWRLVSVQGLHRFYTRGGGQAVVASWMTRQDREAAIADNIEYLDRAVAAASGGDARTIVFLGFSQGASMAARAAARGTRRAAGLVMLGGDIPPDVRDDASVELPRVLLGCGSRDGWYGERIAADIACLESRRTPHDVIRFDGGHEFTDEFRAAAGAWLSARRPR
jgi:predicted esterase